MAAVGRLLSPESPGRHILTTRHLALTFAAGYRTVQGIALTVRTSSRRTVSPLRAVRCAAVVDVERNSLV